MRYKKHVFSSLLSAKFYMIIILLYFLLTRILLSINDYKADVELSKISEARHETKDEVLISNLNMTSSAMNRTKGNQNKKRHSWRKKIAMRKKNFGSLEEWSSEAGMKKVLLWTGYGPLQEGMQLWGRVFSDIGKYQPYDN